MPQDSRLEPKIPTKTHNQRAPRRDGPPAVLAAARDHAASRDPAFRGSGMPVPPPAGPAVWWWSWSARSRCTRHGRRGTGGVRCGGRTAGRRQREAATEEKLAAKLAKVTE